MTTGKRRGFCDHRRSVAVASLSEPNVSPTLTYAMQAWQQRVLPLLSAHLTTTSEGALAAYLLLLDGAATVALLEVKQLHPSVYCYCMKGLACFNNAPT